LKHIQTDRAVQAEYPIRTPVRRAGAAGLPDWDEQSSCTLA